MPRVQSNIPPCMSHSGIVLISHTKLHLVVEPDIPCLVQEPASEAACVLCVLCRCFDGHVHPLGYLPTCFLCLDLLCLCLDFLSWLSCVSI
jgi:hypothetical protein